MKNNKSLNYDQIWKNFSIQNPKLRYTWNLVKPFEDKPCLEIGCGTNPIIPLKKGYFLEVSQAAVKNLEKAGLKAHQGTGEKLPFQSHFFNLVVAWHVLEHVKNDQKAFVEINRVLKKGGYFLLSVPIWKHKFSEFDQIVGHKRRYEPDKLVEILKRNQFKITQYKADRKLFGRFFSKLFTPLLIKMHRNHHSQPSSHLLKSMTNPLMKISHILENRATSNWKKGLPKNLDAADNLVLFCQKNKKP